MKSRYLIFGIVLCTAGCSSEKPLDESGLSCLDKDEIAEIEQRATQGEPRLFEQLHANAVTCNDPQGADAYERDGIIYGNPRFLTSHASNLLDMAKKAKDPATSTMLLDLADLRVDQVIALSRSNLIGAEDKKRASQEIALARKLTSEIDAERKRSR